MLFDLEQDPGERVNLAGHPGHAGIVEKLVQQLDAWDAGRCTPEPLARSSGRQPFGAREKG